jgi:putative intracellular protease/amidase
MSGDSTCGKLSSFADMEVLIVSADAFEDTELLVSWYRFREEGPLVDVASARTGEARPSARDFGLRGRGDLRRRLRLTGRLGRRLLRRRRRFLNRRRRLR